MNKTMTLVASSLSLAGLLCLSHGCQGNGDGPGGGSGGNSAGSPGGSGGGSGGSSSSTTGSGDSITFESGKAVGLFSGFGWVALGALDTISDPTCKLEDGTSKAITKAEACTKQTDWKGDSKLCISGKVPILGTPPDYTGNWGVQIGVNAQEPSDAVGSAMSAFKTVTFTFSGTPASGIRGLFHRKGDDPDKTTPFCMDGIQSGTRYDLLKFNRDCWGPSASTAYLMQEDLANIDIVGIQVPSSTSADITVADLCLEKVQFGK